ncbi:MAG: hypothetical protein IKI66_00900 [Bacteroidales bacterium]|nr:hypothetical protein [Bacteroidales bacterium]
MTMRKILAILLFAAICFNMDAQEGFYNSRPGTTLKWIIYDGDGECFGHCHEKLVRIDGDTENGEIHYAYLFYDSEGKSVTGGKPFAFQVRVKDGRTKAYVNNVSQAIVSGDYMPVGDLSSIPDNIAVGDTLRDTEISIRVLRVFTATNRYANRRVTAQERIEVPAGTFNCFLVEDDEYFTGKGPFPVKTWVARGVGIVRQIIYTKNGSVNQLLELVP